MRQAERSEATRRQMLAAARRLFERRGFDGVAAEEVVALARVTRGALYHHFEDGKVGLFRAVVEELMEEVHDRLAMEGRRGRTPLEALELGLEAFLRTTAEPGVRRILLVDGPAVLGWLAWRELDLQYGMGLLRGALQAASATGQLDVADVETTTHLLAGALVDAALRLGQAPEDRSLRRRTKAALFRLLHGLAPGDRE
ncbi:MAG TPA: helix-turn-helix domain-containing protein [Myxococcaceae bacterium]|nr:helix-turn-helix domain-containing protein [Myxococcaceae bacterium]